MTADLRQVAALLVTTRRPVSALEDWGIPMEDHVLRPRSIAANRAAADSLAKARLPSPRERLEAVLLAFALLVTLFALSLAYPISL